MSEKLIPIMTIKICPYCKKDSVVIRSYCVIDNIKYDCMNCGVVLNENDLIDIPIVNSQIRDNNSHPKRDDDYSDRGFSGCTIYYN